MNTCHICGAPVEEKEDEPVCAGCGEAACSNCNVGGFCLHCLARPDLISYPE